MGNQTIMTAHSDQHDSHPFGAVKEFVSYYHEEMHRNIDRIRRICEKLDAKAAAESVEEIVAVGQAICDLAMVYGFESEELIGRKIIRAAQAFRSDADAGKLREDLLQSARAAEEVMFVMDEKAAEKEVQESGRDETAVEEKPESAQPEAEIPEELPFDIREDEKLISLLSDADGEAVAIDLNGEQEEEIEVLDINSILPEEKKKTDFDIPEEEEKDPLQHLEDDILEIDFREPAADRPGEKKNFFKKLSGLIGRLGKSRISFQE